jgi:hypothetical protein
MNQNDTKKEQQMLLIIDVTTKNNRSDTNDHRHLNHPLSDSVVQPYPSDGKPRLFNSCVYDHIFYPNSS